MLPRPPAFACFGIPASNACQEFPGLPMRDVMGLCTGGGRTFRMDGCPTDPLGDGSILTGVCELSNHMQLTFFYAQPGAATPTANGAATGCMQQNPGNRFCRLVP